MNEPLSFDASFLLSEHSNLTDEVIFAFQPYENKLLFLSAAFEKVWNMPREAVDSDLSLLINTVHPDDRFFTINALTAIQRTKQKQRLELRLLLADQQEKWIAVNAYSTRYNNVDTVIGTATDITAYKEYGNILYKFANKKNAILDILSHDLVSPIGNIQACAQLLLKHTEPGGDEIVNKMLNIITENSKRSIKMIRDLVNKEVLESSEVPLIIQRTDVIQRITEVIEQYKRSYHTIKQQIELVSNVNNLYINVDETKFMQVINNLLSNALKFTRDTDEIKVIVEDRETTILMKVVDTGVGIPADMQPFIFDKFTKARRPGIHGEPTTGLGLSIIKTIVEWHNGRIWFESAEGKGTTFFVQIPKDNR
jgi:two-component system, OmpR family, sensor histidine kinase VicK